MTDADLEELLEVQRQSYARAGGSVRGAWPEESSLRRAELRDFLERLVYGVLATARPDGRAHATPIAFSLEEGAFWIATVAERAPSEPPDKSMGFTRAHRRPAHRAT